MIQTYLKTDIFSRKTVKAMGSNAQIRAQIYSEQVALLYKNAPISYAFTVLNGILLAFLQRSVISNQIILYWFSILILVISARAVLIYLYHHQAKFLEVSTINWHLAYSAGAVSAGVVWGSAAVFLFPESVLEHQLFVVFVLAGMTAGAVPVLAASMLVFLSFVLPVLLTLVFQLFWHGASLSTPMAVMVIFYFLGLTLSALGFNRTILSALKLRFDNHVLLKEIDERQLAEEALHQQKERLTVTFSAMDEGVVVTAKDGHIEYINPAAEIMCGWLDNDAKGNKVEEVLNYTDAISGDAKKPAIYDCLKLSVRAKRNAELAAKNGDLRIIESVASPLKDRLGEIIGAVEIMRDITQASEHSRQLAYQASHDSLTGLPNRTLLCDRLEHAISKATRADSLVAVLFIDLDRFKQINDSLGHAAGDQLLKDVAERIDACVREEDTVSRLGGDEFVVVLEDLVYEDQAYAVAQKIIERLAIPLTIHYQDISVGASIGISLFPRDGRTVETLLKNADTAMYLTKELVQHHIQFYREELSVSGLNRLKLEQQLKQAVARNELELYYQPRICMKRNTILGLEALVRWRTSANTLISPAEFIHIAEETGAILNIGEWVLKTACEQAQSWSEKGHSGLQMAVNLSVRQIRSTNIVGLVAKVLNETKLDPSCLELEITESLFLKDVEYAVMALQDLKAQGVRLALDDFGTGYSSLTYIKQFPVDILKIDKSFINDLPEEPSGAAIIPAIIAMGHGLNLEVVAEGVENEMQREYLKTLGCDSFQGYYYSAPLPAHEMTQLLRDAKLVKQGLNTME